MAETIKVQVRVIRTRSRPEEQTPTGIILFPHAYTLDAVPEKPARQKPKFRRWKRRLCPAMNIMADDFDG